MFDSGIQKIDWTEKLKTKTKAKTKKNEISKKIFKKVNLKPLRKKTV